MINVGKFENAGMIRLVDADGRIFTGIAGEATMKEDEEELGVDKPADWLVVWVAGQPTSFRAEDIKSIEEIE